MTQLDIIRAQVERGEVSRNWCLQQYITRLAARIADLKQEGYTFKEERRGGDFVYKLVEKPTPKLSQCTLSF